MAGVGQPGNGVSVRLTVALVAGMLIAPFLAGCRRAKPVIPSSTTVTESAKTPDGILGLSALEMSSKSITITKASKGAGSGMLLLVDGRGVTDATLAIGDAFLLSDGRHASRLYRLIEIERGWAIFRVHERFNAASFGDGVQADTRTLRFESYCRE